MASREAIQSTVNEKLLFSCNIGHPTLVPVAIQLRQPTSFTMMWSYYKHWMPIKSGMCNSTVWARAEG
eukprot:3835000-Amphidinium_carterae.2